MRAQDKACGHGWRCRAGTRIGGSFRLTREHWGLTLPIRSPPSTALESLRVTTQLDNLPHRWTRHRIAQVIHKRPSQRTSLQPLPSIRSKESTTSRLHIQLIPHPSNIQIENSTSENVADSSRSTEPAARRRALSRRTVIEPTVKPYFSSFTISAPACPSPPDNISNMPALDILERCQSYTLGRCTEVEERPFNGRRHNQIRRLETSYAG
ncbi:hypothetical protein BU24DRAFT_185566 [Aaosphaeria arxii CBS 175.79]|uniref:Uncharacterized protein n=1 Tax=Aaosphaeria arxii CBS 175.79 TaxID=1450172 RepID=A0A6A5XR87_9PLEO|nr:uncharacterized protein BU24DRAFT_185566 [Aaosphaeria arxii CBS 175.79]KAF2015815.1 hypothetical protein BU24DRAFT_185566 [Aaosphaeria arxii CBS 175.79]